MAEQVKVKFVQNAVDEETKINYWNGQEAELPPDNAARLSSAGLLQIVEDPNEGEVASEA